MSLTCAHQSGFSNSWIRIRWQMVGCHSDCQSNLIKPKIRVSDESHWCRFSHEYLRIYYRETRLFTLLYESNPYGLSLLLYNYSVFSSVSFIFWPWPDPQSLLSFLHCLHLWFCSPPACALLRNHRGSSPESAAEAQRCSGSGWRGNCQFDLWWAHGSAVWAAVRPPAAQLDNLWEQAACGCRSRGVRRAERSPAAAEGPGRGTGYGSSCTSWPSADSAGCTICAER